jgi:hypothetical protein
MRDTTLNHAGKLAARSGFGFKGKYAGVSFSVRNLRARQPGRRGSGRLGPRLIQPQLLDRGVDMGSADMEVHPVKLGELVFQRSNDTGQARAIRRRSGYVIQGKIPKLTARSC